MGERKRNELEVIRNHDYTVSVVDNAGRRLTFRDITGADLEFLDRIISPEENGEEATETGVTYENLVTILNFVSVDGKDFSRLSRSVVISVFSIVREHILCNYLSKISWLKACYGMQNGSFQGVRDMERVPMTMFSAMMHIHQEAIDSIKNSNE